MEDMVENMVGRRNVQIVAARSYDVEMLQAGKSFWFH
jgi:hypothetical protein